MACLRLVIRLISSPRSDATCISLAFDQTGLRSPGSREGNRRDSECQDLHQDDDSYCERERCSSSLSSGHLISVFVAIYFPRR